MDEKWFEMKDLKSRNPDKSVWVTLRSEKEDSNSIKYGEAGYKSEFIGVSTLMIPLDSKEVIKNLEWSNAGLSLNHGLNYLWGKYEPVELFNAEDFTATHLVINQNFDNTLDDNVWHLNQDLVVNLCLKREGDDWVCTRRAYDVAVKLERDKEGNPVSIKIKNEYLKDYLCARHSGLFVTSYYSRDLILSYKINLVPNMDNIQEIVGKDIYEFRIREIHEGGMPFGEKIAISHVGRTDVNEDDDIPDMTAPPSDDNVVSSFSNKYAKADKLYHMVAELWKNSWINPAKKSALVLGEEVDFEFLYIVDESGERMSNKELSQGRRWLWFRPEVINNILSKRGSMLSWYTAHTGSIACAPSFGIHFGVNPLGYVNIFAKDIAILPHWQQQIWYAFNASPEGGISKELLSSQVKAVVADTLAPEPFLQKFIIELNELTQDRYSFLLFTQHNAVDELIKRIHRFRAVDDTKLLALAKDVTRFTVDRINQKALKSYLNNSEYKKYRGLKLLERFIATRIKDEHAIKLMTPLFGINELRNSDAHLPSSKLELYFSQAGVSLEDSHITQAYELLRNLVDHLYLIKKVLSS